MASKGNGDVRPRSSRASGQQIEYMINYMLAHKDFATGRLLAAQGRHAQQLQWERLCGMLNDLPGPCKQVAEWKKCWTDYRGNVRNRAAKAKTARERTGNTLVPSDLSDLDLKVLSVVGTDSSLGLPLEEIGLGSRPQDAVANSLALGIAGPSNPIPEASEVDVLQTPPYPIMIQASQASDPLLQLPPSSLPVIASSSSSPLTCSAPIHTLDPQSSSPAYFIKISQNIPSSQPVSSPHRISVPMISPSLPHSTAYHLPTPRDESPSYSTPSTTPPATTTIPIATPTATRNAPAPSTSTSTSPAVPISAKRRPTRSAAQSAYNSTALESSLATLKDMRGEDREILKEIREDVRGMREAMERIARAVERLVDG